MKLGIEHCSCYAMQAHTVYVGVISPHDQLVHYLISLPYELRSRKAPHSIISWEYFFFRYEHLNGTYGVGIRECHPDPRWISDVRVILIHANVNLQVNYNFLKGDSQTEYEQNIKERKRN